MTRPFRSTANTELARVLAQFEQFCTVGQSVAQGIPTRVTLRGPDGALLHGEAA